MGCCPSKPPALGKDYAVIAAEVSPILPSTASANPAKMVLDDAVGDMTMDRGDEALLIMDKLDDEEPVPEEEEFKLHAPAETVLDEVLVRNPETTTTVQCPPQKTPRNADDIPISSTYHRVHSAEVAKQEAMRQEELRLEAEHREQEIREYKAAIGLSY